MTTATETEIETEHKLEIEITGIETITPEGPLATVYRKDPNGKYMLVTLKTTSKFDKQDDSSLVSMYINKVTEIILDERSKLVTVAKTMYGNTYPIRTDPSVKRIVEKAYIEYIRNM